MSKQKKTKTTPIAQLLEKAKREGYKRGYADGRWKRKRLVECMTITNAQLWEHLKLLDEEEPLEGVVISFTFADQVIKALRDHDCHHTYANMLRRRYREAKRTSKINVFLDALKKSRRP